ncbi:hypothetical protein PanWU01x14_188550 [Parasponia andersonii]|uniref:KIB1-4 beta-propeller domain-containing protein n=1 Tax=Parasponia andersonii TaxID=3476 RepID=A0A2P5C2X6_PARAD|nr:hypothetical protein PanWU01x14_188550 [Parasponia andersonii]
MLHHHEVPMLLVPNEQEHSWSIYNVLEDKFLDLNSSILYNKRFCGSSQGWLGVVNKDYTVTLNRPHFISKGDISDGNTSIQLPQLFPPETFFMNPEDFQVIEDDPEDIYVFGYDYHVKKIFITSDPLSNPKDCTIFVIYGQYCKLACMRYEEDKTWIKIADGFRGFEDMVYYKNQLYAIDFSSTLRSFDPYNGTINWVAPELHFTLAPNRYLVESCGDLLLVERYINFIGPNGLERETTAFTVLKFDLDRVKWTEIESLGSVALFVGDNSAISVVASNFSRCRANCIYFTHDEIAIQCRTDKLFDLGVYSLESKSFMLHYNLDRTTFHRMFQRPPIWIVPLPNGH